MMKEIHIEFGDTFDLEISPEGRLILRAHNIRQMWEYFLNKSQLDELITELKIKHQEMKYENDIK